MDLNGFYDKTKIPDEAELAKALGFSISHWNGLKRLIGTRFTPLTEEWVFSGKSHGWALRLKQKKRAVLYLKPLEGHFRASFALGEKAVQAAHRSELPAAILKLIDDAPKYPEGRGVRMEIAGDKDVSIAVKLAEIKMAN